MVRVSRILCAVDFSRFSRRALDWALALARWHGARITVLHVHQLFMPAGGAGALAGPGVVPVGLTDADRASLLERLNEFVAAARVAAVSVETLVHEAPNVPRAIIEAAREDHADLIALGTHGRSGFDRWVLGSVAEKVVRTAACPVLTVPVHEHELARAAPLSGTLERIVCPIDWSPASASALDHAHSLAQVAGARLTVVHVVELAPEVPEPPLPEFFEYRTRCFEQARKRLAAEVPAAVREGGAVDELVLVGKAHREIVRLAGEQQADLIVMGVHGGGLVDRALFGSTATQVLRRATCPVLTVRGDAR
jgi:nucleotide-binding universal stress UspA family protein